jgi:cell fate (sporulation/competence/biofilm development) regulator YlbF (YheA/YmcA/DUF963 family)
MTTYCKTLNELQKYTKAELITELMNEQERADSLYDQYEILKEEIENLEDTNAQNDTYFAEYHEMKDIIEQINTCHDRISLGVMSETEELYRLYAKLGINV